MEDVRFIGQDEQDLRDLFGGEVPEEARQMYARMLRLYHRKGSGSLPPVLLLLIAALNGGGEKPPPQPSAWDGVPPGVPVRVTEYDSPAPLHEHATFISVGREHYSGYLEVEVYGQRMYFTEDRVVRKPDEPQAADEPEAEEAEPQPSAPRQRVDWSAVEPGAEVVICQPGEPEKFGRFVRKPGGSHEGLLYIQIDGEDEGNKYSHIPIADVILSPVVMAE